MTENSKQEKEKRTNLIPYQIERAFYLGAASGVASVFLFPPEYIPRGALIGAGCSLFLSWLEMGPRKTRKRGGRKITVGGIGGQRTINMEYSVNGGYITRRTWGETFTDLIWGKPRPAPMVRENKPVPRPKELDDFYWVSQGIELREEHVKLFLKSAWANSANGKAVSARYWARGFSQRPAWFKELSPAWFFAMRQLLLDAQAVLGVQLIIVYGNGWSRLANHPHLTLSYLKWYESKRKGDL